MNWAADDFETIRSRLKQIKAVKSGKLPPFVMGASMAGHHCPCCPEPSDGPCAKACTAEYQKTYGINPYGTEADRIAAGTKPPNDPVLGCSCGNPVYGHSA